MTTFKINNMTCGSCARRITDKIKTVDNNANTEVDIKNRTVTIGSPLNAARFEDAITNLGYKAELLIN